MIIINKTIKISLFFFFLFGIYNSAFSQFSKRNKEIARLKESIKFYKAELKTVRTGNDNFYKENKRLISIIEGQEKEIERLRKRDSTSIVIQNPPMDDEPPNPTSTGDNSFDSQFDSTRYISIIAELRREILLLRRQNNKNLKVIEGLKRDTNFLGNLVRLQKDSIYNLTVKAKKLKDSLDYYKQIVDSVELFLVERENAKRYARSILDSVALKFSEYSQLNFSEKNAFRKDLWDIYSKYDTKSTSKNCGPFTLNATDDLKNGWDHYYNARILVDDKGEIFNKMDDDYCEKVHEMNKGMIDELGQALAQSQNDYSLRRECYSLLEKLIPLIVTERQCWEDTIKGKPSSLAELEKIHKDFNKGDYASAMGKYNRGYRLLELDEVKEDSALVAEVKYSIGTILLWNLGDLESYRGLASEGSWFKEHYRFRKNIAPNLLNDAIRLSEKGSELRQKAFVATRKKY
ncbi:MAG: hypothetical protein AAFZ15_29470 [Bacteroidota bacterium]